MLLSQASDTDILALVEIENNSSHHFEFFMGRVSEEPISARTAWAYSKFGGEISHGLSVYSCQLQQPNQVKRIIVILEQNTCIIIIWGKLFISPNAPEFSLFFSNAVAQPLEEQL